VRLNAGLAEISQAIAAEVSRAAPLLAAIRIAPGRHVSGVGWPPDLVITADPALPPQESYAVVLPGGEVVAGFVLRRHAPARLVALRLPGTTIASRLRPANPPEVGALALVVGANADASPTARLSAVHSVETEGNGRLSLDAAPGTLADGSLVLDSEGALLGLCTGDAEGESRLASCSEILELVGMPAEAVAPIIGWIGASLQPVIIGRELRAIAGQAKGRLVVSLAPHGPAHRAGIRTGDVLLAIDGQPVNGRGTVRRLLETGRIGQQLELRLARAGQIATRHVVIEPFPRG
jgi:S1-C subfamily serine protease